MDDYYPEDAVEDVFEPREDEDLFVREVIGGDEDLLLVHHLLVEAFRERKLWAERYARAEGRSVFHR